MVRWPRETGSPFGLGERVAAAYEHCLSCQKISLAMLDRSRVSGATEARSRGRFNECNDAKTTSKIEGLTPEVRGNDA